MDDSSRISGSGNRKSLYRLAFRPETTSQQHVSPLACASGRHLWIDPENRRRCCNGYVRVSDSSRAGLETVGAEHIVLSQVIDGLPFYRGWLKEVDCHGA